MPLPEAPKGHSASIDGLRSIAVIPVLVGHAFPKLLPGGFIGVDIFFVISGFLIASMIVDRAAAGRFSMADFYKRRVLRIFPALFAMLVASTIAALWLLPPFPLREFGQALVASATFVSNLLFWSKSGYFDAAAEANPLVHTWSLAVEEQFYIVAPLIALLVLRGRNWLYAFLAAAVLGSLLFAGATNDTVPSTFFFFTANRIFELAIGCVVGCAFYAQTMGEGRRLVENCPRWAIEAIAALALAALCACFFAFGPRSYHPGLITLVPVLATSALLALHASGSLTHRLLAQGPFVWVGLISYSLYLVHQPILAFARYAWLQAPPTGVVLACLVASIPLAYLSWRFVEQPFRDYRRFSLRATLGGGAIAIALACLAGLALHFGNGFTQRYAAGTVELVRPPAAAQLEYSPIAISPGTRFVLWGDSHAEMLAPTLRRWADASGGTVDLFRNGGCPPIPGFDNDWRNLEGPRCSTFNAETLARIEAMPKGTVVVLAARWPNYLRAPLEVDEFGHPWTLASRSIFPSSASRWQGDPGALAAQSLAATFARLQAAGMKVVIVDTVPRQRDHADNLGFILRGDRDAIEAQSISREFHADASNAASEMLRKALRQQEGVTRIDPATTLCDEVRCGYLLDGRMAYRDDNHLNDWGAHAVSRAIVEAAIAGEPDERTSRQ
ncbi:acyltransferase family protein [Parerythrobacter lacustris]|uniref:Acyltransferase n=1 Tax=Parerythrobacter lacustris TaxID=2969984 RepID=A0ABT1XSZ8_9SPHN|nr:acyltransferase [Parerythrobacter lacustris]